MFLLGLSGQLSFAAGLILIIVGLWTYSFDHTDGLIHQFQPYPNEVSGNGKNSISVTPKESIKYSYSADSKSYVSERIGMGFRNWTLSPLGKMQWELDYSNNKPITVYYSARFPSVSVLHRGFDVLSSIVLLLAGYALMKFKWWLHAHVDRD